MSLDIAHLYIACLKHKGDMSSVSQLLLCTNI